MAMYPCNKCFENSWKYELPDPSTVRATCKLCGYEVEFATKRSKRPPKVYPPFVPHFTREEIENQDGPPPW